MPEDKLDTLSKKLDGVADDVRSNSYRIDKLEAKIEGRFDSLGTQIDKLANAVRELADTVTTVSRQFTAVTSKVIEHDQRMGSVESRVSVLETH